MWEPLHVVPSVERGRQIVVCVTFLFGQRLRLIDISSKVCFWCFGHSKYKRKLVQLIILNLVLPLGFWRFLATFLLVDGKQIH